MTDSLTERFTHYAVAMSRRRSLRLLGGAGLAATLAAPAATNARKGGKNARDRCRKYGAQCRAAIAEICAPLPDPACEAVFDVCCEHFARCRMSAGVQCVLENE